MRRALPPKKQRETNRDPSPGQKPAFLNSSATCGSWRPWLSSVCHHQHLQRQVRFCGFAVDRFDPKQRRSVTLAEARDVIDICVKNHIGYLLFVGGEPLVHRDLRAMTRYAAERGIRPMVCTNGSLWTEQNMRDLTNDGLSSVIMSIDAHDVAKHEKNRGLPEVCRKIPTRQ